MAKIYVAGKNLERARAVMNMLVDNGHEITFDWVKDIKNSENSAQKAKDEREAIKNAEVLVYLWESNQESARYEAGMAMGLHKPIIISGFKNSPFFTSLPEVISISSDSDIISVLEKL